MDFCTVFNVIVVVWFPVAPVLIVWLAHSCWKYTKLGQGWDWHWEKCENNKLLLTAEPSLQTNPWLVPRLKPIQAASEEWNLYDIRKKWLLEWLRSIIQYLTYSAYKKYSDFPLTSIIFNLIQFESNERRKLPSGWLLLYALYTNC